MVFIYLYLFCCQEERKKKILAFFVRCRLLAFPAQIFGAAAAMASPSVAVSLEPNDSKLDWRKMNKQELRDALASRGLDTSGLRPLLIQRLESSLKASAPAASQTSSVVTQDLPAANLLNGILTESKLDNGTVKIPEEEPTGKVRDVFEDKHADSIGLDLASKTSSEEEEKVVVERKCELEGSISVPISDLDRKRKRAERFGVGLKVSEEEKLVLRAERFSGKKKTSHQESESEKRKQRAARFGIVDEAAKKKAREQRFGIVNQSLSEDAKRKARAERFGTGNQKNSITGVI